ncbi:hypothetical protein AQUCO_03100016v1 [Aquilegia coerulea]|uniref:Terpene cyclase/mutase family member n=1 Tax=Aquilegia coerulea TaxID=218851 RepID=A0A2G5D0F0_AQUCA|nr:hypothetical protein AQUCO_03100016v1 [Aquilegia coerulea]
MWKLKVAHDGGPYREWLYSTNNFIGRQTWEFDPDAGTPEERAEVEKTRQEYHNNRFHIKPCGDILLRLQMLKEKRDKFDLSIPPVKLGENESITNDAITTTLKRGVRFFSTLQTDDGHWAANIGGPLFFMPPLVFVLYITGMLDTILSPNHKKEILRYIYCHQNEDGGWGLHIESHSTMFCTTINYVCMRLLGEGLNGGEDDACAKGRKWIRDHGGILGLYDWSGCNPMPPEFWLLPSILPMHPAKMWCYCRLIYMPMSYLYGKRFVGPITNLILSLRKELHVEPFHQINWNKTRHVCAKEDLYYPHPFLQDMIWDSLYVFMEPLLTRWPLSRLREKALRLTMKHIHYEDENSRYITIGCCEKALCMLACWVENPNSDAFKKHLARIPDYLWVAEDGMSMQCFGSQTWDTCYAVQALIACNFPDEIGNTLKKGHDYIKQSQVLIQLYMLNLYKFSYGEEQDMLNLYKFTSKVTENPSGDFRSMHRHISKGSWTFSDKDQGWQVSDCTAEGLISCLLLSQMPEELVGKKMETERMYEAVNFIIYLQSKNGGLAVWEPATGHDWLESPSHCISVERRSTLETKPLRANIQQSPLGKPSTKKQDHCSLNFIKHPHIGKNHFASAHLNINITRNTCFPLLSFKQDTQRLSALQILENPYHNFPVWLSRIRHVSRYYT